VGPGRHRQGEKLAGQLASREPGCEALFPDPGVGFDHGDRVLGETDADEGEGPPRVPESS
jgi:hypothetical protein